VEDTLAAWLKRQMDSRGIKSINTIEAYTGIKHASLFGYLNGTTVPSPKNLEKLAAYFHVDPGYLYELVGHKPGRTRFPGRVVPPEWEAEFGRIEALPDDLQALVWIVLRKQLDACEAMANARLLAEERAKR
jgi:transcriptional regulator with XRE-family HTH domain